MPRSATAHRLTPASAAPPALSLAAEEPPAAAPASEAKVIPLVPVPVASVLIFRVGNYEVGDGYCPQLHGHPDIRY